MADAGILNYERELAGLQRGNDALQKQTGAYVTSNKAKYMKKVFNTTRKDLKEKMKQHSINGSGLSQQIGVKALRSASSLHQAIKANPSDPRTIAALNLAYVPKKSKDFEEVAAKVYQKERGKELGERGNEVVRKWNQALTRRHELDEIRENQIIAQKIKKNPRLRPEDFAPKKIGASSHISPKVIARESANIAVAPKVVRDTYKVLRTATGEAHLPEYDIFFPKHLMRKTYHDYGLNYGESGVYNPGLGNRLEKAVLREKKK